MVMLALLVLVAAACTTKVTTSDGRPIPPDPRPAPPAPVGQQINAMAMRVGSKPADANGNGYPDLIPVEVYLYAEPHPTSFHPNDGAFEFELYPLGQGYDESEPLARWRLEGEVVEDARMRHALWGAGYAFRLSLLDSSGTDLYPLMAANILCRFEQGEGEPVRSRGEHTIRIGRRDGG
jgi:hypothetical protein